ncbi:flagellar biosynthesis protein FlhB [Thioclava sp. SK-1]|uniref:EscU/YscU/HrcU family type III secretion system export apparatus switch protein n=1 Tax=Thioclava sp. SK-1 TaxID=1889770 RepID=UPI0008271107|nr:flagellar type III secretion system protein FlhB [Thioclava sp. SK-1]OCX65301.1 flagellar biosynthesis protein FlhB [Thioclava sp. SK-1]
MSEDDAGGEKEYEATQHKLDQARKRGELVKSAEITVAASYAGFLIAAYGMGVGIVQNFGGKLATLIGNSDHLSLQVNSPASTVIGGILAEVLPSLLPIFIIPIIAVLAGLQVQRAVVFAPEKLEMKLSRINPIANAKQKFGRNGLFEFGKSFVKLGLISLILGLFLSRQMDRILMTQHVDVIMASADLMRMIIEFLAIVVLLSGIMGAVDYLWQRAEFLRKNRMSRKEMTDEMKQSEGDPHMKQHRRQRGIELAMNQMLTDVPTADVIIVNPTHYAVALKWQRGSGRAPICVAKGVDEIAARIREIAGENNVPIHRDPPTARALHATLEIGQEVQPEQYKAVAAAIRFAEKMRQRVKGRMGA